METRKVNLAIAAMFAAGATLTINNNTTAKADTSVSESGTSNVDANINVANPTNEGTTNFSDIHDNTVDKPATTTSATSEESNNSEKDSSQTNKQDILQFYRRNYQGPGQLKTSDKGTKTTIETIDPNGKVISNDWIKTPIVVKDSNGNDVRYTYVNGEWKDPFSGENTKITNSGVVTSNNGNHIYVVSFDTGNYFTANKMTNGTYQGLASPLSSLVVDPHDNAVVSSSTQVTYNKYNNTFNVKTTYTYTYPDKSKTVQTITAVVDKDGNIIQNTDPISSTGNTNPASDKTVASPTKQEINPKTSGGDGKSMGSSNEKTTSSTVKPANSTTSSGSESNVSNSSIDSLSTPGVFKNDNDSSSKTLTKQVANSNKEDVDNVKAKASSNKGVVESSVSDKDSVTKTANVKVNNNPNSQKVGSNTKTNNGNNGNSLSNSSNISEGNSNSRQTSNSDSNGQESLPQTGEDNNDFANILGLGMLGSALSLLGISAKYKRKG